MKATDISAPHKTCRLGGQDVNLRFDHNMMRMTEIYYQASTLRSLGYFGILAQAGGRTFCALGALAYGAAAATAMAEGSRPITMAEFDRMVTYEELRAAADALMEGVIESMPKAENQKGNA